MFYLVYVSSATELLTATDLGDILSVSVRNNARWDISGALLYKGGNFLQILEGEETVVRGTYASISGDPRHSGLLVTLCGHQAARQFPHWSMAFQDLTGPKKLDAPGYSEFLNTPLTASEFGSDPGRSERLLMIFKESMQ
jgi:hypothetical protein